MAAVVVAAVEVAEAAVVQRSCEAELTYDDIDDDVVVVVVVVVVDDETNVDVGDDDCGDREASCCC